MSRPLTCRLSSRWRPRCSGLVGSSVRSPSFQGCSGRQEEPTWRDDSASTGSPRPSDTVLASTWAVNHALGSDNRRRAVVIRKSRSGYTSVLFIYDWDGRHAPDSVDHSPSADLAFAFVKKIPCADMNAPAEHQDLASLCPSAVCTLVSDSASSAVPSAADQSLDVGVTHTVSPENIARPVRRLQSSSQRCFWLPLVRCTSSPRSEKGPLSLTGLG